MFWFCTGHDIDVEFPVGINSKCAIKELGEIFKHLVEILLLGHVEV